MVNFYDISDWEEHKYYGTGGTRDKVVVENPEDGDLYYFKTSLRKKVIDYKYEFWSEIIASEIGSSLKLNILHYDVAWKEDRLGCLSKSMIDPRYEELQEGYKWLTGYHEDYDVTDKSAYTFQLIEELLLNRFENEDFIKDIIEIIVFDSIIGNEDRHQENWSIIVTNKLVGKSSLFGRKKAVSETTYSFAPIYDSGSSLGRELTDTKVAQMLKDSVQMEAYINRGQSEIHWSGEKGKQKHFDLITKISDSGHKDTVIDIINSIRIHYNESVIIDIISNNDNCLPNGLTSLKIPKVRKDFIIKLVTLRFRKLFELQL